MPAPLLATPQGGVSPEASVVVTTWNRLDMTRQCLDSLLATKTARWRLTVVDNGSQDGTVAYLEQLKAAGALDALFLLRSNMGVAVAHNLGWAAFAAAYYIKVDNDVVACHPLWLDALLEAAAAANSVGMAGYRLCAWHGGEPVTLQNGQSFLQGSTCGGGCVCIPATAHARLGFWNEDYSPYGYEDNEYGLRANLAGLRTGYVPLPHVTTLDTKDAARDREDAYTRTKFNTVDAARTRRLWFVNLFLFQNGLRPLHVARRYLPSPCPPQPTGTITFRPNPAYAAVRAQQRAVAQSPAFQHWLAAQPAEQELPEG